MGRIPEDLDVEVEVKLLKDGKVIMDGLTASLLEAISRTGSLLAAAKSLGIPYSKAWRSISSLERRIGGPVIVPRRGGRCGGGTELTEAGKELLLVYSRIRRRYALPRSLEPLSGIGGRIS